MIVDNFEKLLDDFNNLPKLLNEPTYLELCKYPHSRFEEVCSRLLCFYFNPTNEHNFYNLFIKSLFDVINPQENILFKSNEIQVINELNSEGKRLDILIKSPEIIIGIENKIYASVYNPLEIYSKQINLFGKKNVFKIILTVKSITNKSEKNYIKQNGFIIVTYTKFFNKIKQNIGDYISQANQKHLQFIYDFIKTIENMTGTSQDNNELSQFFYSNSNNINSMIELFNKYNNRIFTKQQERASEIKDLIVTKTGDKSWWLFEGWDLGIDSFNKITNKPRIGIESSFKNYKNNPLGQFKIFITTWKLKDFVPYEDKLVEMFPNAILDKTKDDRVYLHVETIEGNDEIYIVEKLYEYYKIMINLQSTQEVK